MITRKCLLMPKLILLLFLSSCCDKNDSKTSFKDIVIDEGIIINVDTIPVKDTTPFIEYWDLSNSQQIPYRTKKLTSAKVKLFPNYGNRKKLGITQLNDVYGINQFFMDYDLTSGDVHDFTKKFYKSLTPDDFVLFLKRDESYINEGEIFYKKVKDLSPLDSLGQNIGFFRQWKLSDIDMEDNKVNVKKFRGTYNLQVKQHSSNQFKALIPLWSKQTKEEGYIDISKLNVLTDNDGGTAVIIWETKENEVFFIDIHSSINDIIECLMNIHNEYDVGPTLGIYDAAPMARKFKSDKTNSVDFKSVNLKTSHQSHVGAGFGYKIIQY